jgi:hypothetical protein
VGDPARDDGIVSTNLQDNQLLTTRNDAMGQPIRPVITLHLSASFYVEKISIYGGDVYTNVIPGALSSAVIAVGDTAATVPGQPFGYQNVLGQYTDDLFDVTATPLTTVPTSTVVLRDLTAKLFGMPFDQFSITEITVEGRPAVQEIGLDVKPGDPIAALNPNSNGTTPVAILSSATFNAVTDVDRESVTFGKTGSENSVVSWRVDDVNRDGLPDLIFDAATANTGFIGGETTAYVRGQTVTGASMEGSDQIAVLAH